MARTVGRYELIREVGRGGMAVVHLAWQPDLERHVALKELAAFHAADHASVERFLNESRIAGSLSHPNIITVHDFFEHEGVPFIAMEYLERQSLRPLVGHLGLAQTAGVLEGLLAALDYAGAREIVHRDLKPENVMLTSGGGVKIADFGIAKAYTKLATARVLTTTGTTVGTPAYMSPEQALGRPVGPQADLYSVGVIAYELLVGRVPFERPDTPVAVLLAHVNDPLPDPREIDPELDPRLGAWLERMLAKDPEDRFVGALEAWDALEGVVIEALGPRWRRDARLPEPVVPGEAALPDDASADPEPEQDSEANEAWAGAWSPTVAPKREPSPSASHRRPAPSGAESARRRPSLGARIVLMAGILLAVTAGYLTAQLGSASNAAPAATRVSNGELALDAPAGWQRAEKLPELPGLRLSKPVGLSPDGASDGPMLAFGRTSAEGPLLLSRRFARTVPEARARRQRVRLAGLHAYRYPDLAPRGAERRLVLYVVPTTAGAATVVCYSKPGGGPPVGACDEAAGTLDLLRGGAQPLGPSEAYADGLDATMRTLDRGRRQAGARLQNASTARAQAEALAAFGSIYRRARRTLPTLPVTLEARDAHAALVAGVERTAAAYRRAASAARGGRPREYGAAAAAARGGQSSIRRALRQIAGAGYDVRPPETRKGKR
jgi:hypothetical protein